MANFYDFETINKDVPIEEVLSIHGIHPSSKGNGWYSIRQESEPSAHIDKDKRFGNTIHDFGVDNTFNPISLTAYLQDIDVVAASRFLGEAFGIEPIRRDKNNENVISNWEWEFINIQPDMASKNIDLYPDKYGHERTQAFVEKYNMPMSELKTKDVRMFERIVRSRAVAYILDMRSDYYKSMYDDYLFIKAVSKNFEDDKIFESNSKKFEELAKELTKAENILKKVIKDTPIKFQTNHYNAKVDFYKVINGEVSFEIGESSYNDIRRAAFQDKLKVFSTLVNYDEYKRLMENGMNNINVAAFKNGDQVKLYFLSSDSSRVHFLVKALRGKETELNKQLSDVDAFSHDEVVENSIKDYGGKGSDEKNGAELKKEKSVKDIDMV